MEVMRKTAIFILITALAVFGYSPPPVRAEFEGNLGYGARGQAVAELQQFLRDQGVYSGPVTGAYLSLTQEGVRSFQRREGISPVSGYFGPLTRSRANALLGGGGGGAASTASLEARLRDLLAEVARLQAMLGSVSSAPTSTATTTAAAIPAQSIVALNCYFRYLPTGEVLNLAKGSGAIVRADGLVLTARHLVDLQFSHSVDPSSVPERFARNAAFDHCDVGQIPPGTVLPSPDDIRRINPSVLVPVLGYEAKLTFVPAGTGLSAEEEEALDFALLRITGVSKDGPFFGINSLPAAFEHAPLASGAGPQIGDEVSTFGFPGDFTQARRSSFGTFYLLGSVGKVKRIGGGNFKFRNQPLLINTNMEVRGGRSGSPLFFGGEIAGVITSHSQENVSDSFSVSASAIRRILAEANISL
jgi:peptidoglycan hydrolase-like protein with peptidoglycan-binding domain